MSPSRTSASTMQLHRMLDLSRELLQAADFHSAMSLIGPVLRDIFAPDGAVLLVSIGGHEHRLEFDCHGVAHPAHKHPLLIKYARQIIANEQVPLPDAGKPGTPNILAVTFPPVQSIGTLLIFWNRNKHKDFIAKRRPVLQQLTELIAASIGNLDARTGLERQISAQTDEIAEITEEHAQEIKRRDHLEAKMHRISITDVMTGLRNRRGFFLQAEQSFKVARRRKLMSAVIFADIDGLKSVNDELGHEAGDQLIRDSARIFQGAFRISDVVARLGGDEFVAFTVDDTQTEIIIARVRENIEAFNRTSTRPYEVAFSIGVAQCDPATDSTLPDYLAMADKRMYAQKMGQPRLPHYAPVFSPAMQPGQ